MVNSSTCSGTEYPVLRIASTTVAGEVASGWTVTRADSAAKFTFATTPGSLFRLFSIRAAQAAQVMPSIGMSKRSADDDSIDLRSRIGVTASCIIYPYRVFVKYQSIPIWYKPERGVVFPTRY